MNLSSLFSIARTAPRHNAIPAPAARLAPRERDFGVGYGRSSGYASYRRYSPNWAPPRFNFA